MKLVSCLTKTALVTFVTFLGMSTLSSCSIQTWKTNVQIVLAGDGSKLADRSFSETVFNGITSFFEKDVYNANESKQKWTPPNVNSLVEKISGVWRKSSGTDWMSYIETYQDASTTGAKVLTVVGFPHSYPLQVLTSTDEEVVQKQPSWFQNLRDTTGFINVDGELFKTYDDGKKHSDPFNVASIAFKVDEAAFLAGIMTGIFLNTDDYYKPVKINFGNDKYKSVRDRINKIDPSEKWYEGRAFLVGGFMGLAIPSTIPFLNGWCEGIDYFNKNILNDKNVKNLTNKQWYPLAFVSPTGDYDNLEMENFCSGSFSPTEERAKSITNKYLNQDVSAILPIAGPQTSIAIEQIYTNRKRTAVIGVDTDKENNTSVNKINNGDHWIVPMSILKKLDASVRGVLQAINSSLLGEENKSGYAGFGYNNWSTLENGGVGISHDKLLGDSNTADYYKKAVYSEPDKDGKEKFKETITEKIKNIDGKEFTKDRYVKINGSLFVSVPKIDKNNQYNKISVNEQIGSDDAIKKFTENLKKSIGTVENNGQNARINWFMKRE